MASEVGVNHFGIIDYVVVSGTLIISLFIGVFYAMKKQTTEDLLVGGRSMGPLPVAASMMVTYFSAISILGYPAEIVYHGMEMFMMTLTTMMFAPLSAFIFVPVFFDMRLTSIFKYFELRFDSLATRWIASILFILQTLFVSAVILYAPSIAIETILGVPRWISIIAIGVSCTIYTSVGGLKAVVWTDVFQLVMILIGMSAIVIKGLISAGGLVSAFEIAGEHGRLNLINLKIDPFMRHNTLNFIVGFGFTIVGLVGTHQPQVQRYSSLPTSAIAIKAILMSVPINIVAATLVLLTGISIFATYATCDPLRNKEIKHPDQIVGFFVTNQLAFIPGMLGLFISCIFSAVLSSISSVLNSLSAVTWEDFCMKTTVCQKLSPKLQAHSSRFISALYGVLIIGLAFLCQNMGQLLPMLFTVIGASAGPQSGLFIMGLFFPVINKYGAVTGMLTGIAVMVYLAGQAFQNKQIHMPLPTSVDDCPETFSLASMSGLNTTINATTSQQEIEWPEKLYTLSYLLYPIVGAILTIIVSLIVSALTGGFCNTKSVNPKYLHRSIRKFKCVSSEKELQMTASITRQADYDLISKQSSPYSATNSYTYYPYNYEMVPNSANGTAPNEILMDEKRRL